ncbi:MAG: cobaltochelatase subunit CobN, partial [Vicinamibacterales bacterium]
MMTIHRQRVVRGDGRAINVVQRRAHLSYCCTGCCCGRTERGYEAVPTDTFKYEWLQRKLRNIVHLTKAGCLGPCALANVASLVFDGRAVWFHSVNTPWHVRLIYDYIDTMVRADRFVAPPAELTEYVFNFYDWDARPHHAPAMTAITEDVARSTRIALLSHADTDLLALRHARSSLPDAIDAIGISLLRLQSEEQLSLLLDGDLTGAGVIVLRVHGELEGVPGLSRLREWARQRNTALVVVSGTGEPRADFVRASTVGLDVVDAVRLYLTLGGERNVAECVKFLSDRLLLTGFSSAPPLEVPEHGVYLRDVEHATLDEWRRRADPARPTVAMLFYRAHLASGNVAFIDDLVDALNDRGMNALPVFTSSLRARANGYPVALQIIGDRADIVISTLSFALAEAGAAEQSRGSGPEDVPAIQAITSGMPREAWEVSRRGVTALDTAINVAIPEIDGRIVAVPISFKDRSEDAPGLYAPHAERIARVAGLARALARLRHLPRADVRVVFVLTNSQSKASQVGNAVGLDAPASLLNLLRATRRAGFAIDHVPATSDELMTSLLARGSYD